MRRYWILLLLVLVTCCATAPVYEDPPRRSDWLYETLVFEIAPVGTVSMPSKSALKFFREKLDLHGLCRRERVRFYIKEPEPISPGVWHPGAVLVYEQTHRSLVDKDVKDAYGMVFVAYATGPIIRNGSMAFLGGIQYAPSSFMVFKDGAGAREGAVLLHEFGHMIGLRKQDEHTNEEPEHRHHCLDQNCVMYYRTHSPYADFCESCQQRLKALRQARRAKRSSDK